MKRVVIKVGSHVLSDEQSISIDRLEKLCEFLAQIMKKFEVILVSSGAISAGKTKLDLPRTSLLNKQILAAVGQPFLIEIYNKTLAKLGLTCAQILLTASDFDSIKRTSCALNVIDGLIDQNIIPIINENDATAIKEIVYGDNDRLSSSVTYYFNADLLVILSDIDGYYESDPRLNSEAKIIPIVTKIQKEEYCKISSAGSPHGTGGIATKLEAANFLMKRGKNMFLSSGFDLNIVREFLINENQIGGTLFKGSK